MSEKKNNDQPENVDEQISNYEELLNGFSDGEDVRNEEPKESEDGIALSELLDGIDGQEEKAEVPDKSEEFSLDEIGDINLDDITPEEVDVIEGIEGTETEDETVSKTDTGKFEIDLDALEEEGSGDYSSILSEIGGGETSETEGELGEAEMETEEAPAEPSPEEIAMEIEEPETSYASLIEEESTEEGAEISEPLESIEETGAEEAPEEVSPEEIAMEIEEPETSYASLIEEESTEEGAEISEPLESIEETGAEEAPEEVSPEEIAMEIEEPETSYASLIEEESTESSSEETAMEIEDEGSDKEVFEKLADNEYSLEDEEAASEPEEEFSLPVESEEEAVTSEFSAAEDTEETFVISGEDTEEPEEEDFLNLDEETSSGDDFLAGVAGVKESPSTEVMLEGIEMDAEEQISTVTRAELLLSQGKEKEAAELFASVSEKKGVTPWVSKRLGFLNIQEQPPESETEGEIEEETKEEN